MKSETSFFSRGIFINNLKSQGWIGIVYFLVLVFCIPLNMLMIYSNRIETEYYQMKMILLESSYQRIAIFIFPVLLAILLFRYLQDKNTSVMIHSLPVTRGTLFRTKIFTGLLLLILPTIFTAFLIWTLQIGLDLDSYFTTWNIGYWLGFTILIELVLFLTAVMMGMITGMSTVQGVLTYIMLLLPTALTLLVIQNLDYLVSGISHNYSIESVITKFSPILRLLETSYINEGGTTSIDFFTWTEVIIYILVCVIVYRLSSWLYNRRKIEAASQTITMNGLKPIFKYGVTFCSMLVSGMYFNSTAVSNEYWVYFGYILGSFVGYLIAEMILKKSIWVFKSLKGYSIYAGIILVVFLGITFDITGYERNIPDIKNVQSVYFGNGYSYNIHNSQEYMDTYYNQKNIEAIRELHRQIIADKDILKNYRPSRYSPSVQQMTFAYKLKDGSKIIREYMIPFDKYASFIKPIYESTEYKEKHNGELNVNADRVDKITITPAVNDVLIKKAVIINPKEIKEALGILQKEITDEKFEGIINKGRPWANINLFMDNDKQVHSTFKRGYHGFEAWLKQKGYWQDAVILPKDIKYVMVKKINWDYNHQGYSDNENGWKIVNKEQIAESFENYQEDNGNGEYLVYFYSEDDREIINGIFTEGNAPDFIKNYFNKN